MTAPRAPRRGLLPLAQQWPVGTGSPEGAPSVRPHPSAVVGSPGLSHLTNCRSFLTVSLLPLLSPPPRGDLSVQQPE